MKIKRVREIVVPYQEGLTLTPSVTLSDKVIDALKIMLKNDLKRIIVVHNGKPIGMLRLEDVFQCLGLQENGS